MKYFLELANPRGVDGFEFWRNLDPWFDEVSKGERFLTNFKVPVDVEETEDDFKIVFDIPGVDKSNIRIDLKDGYLDVSGERKTEKSHEKGTRRLIERSYGNFHRTLRLPTEVDEQKIEAFYRDGVLTIRIPKAKQTQRRSITIKDTPETVK